jgi:hypothetical protein
LADILACIDASDYANSVCDHAAWFAGRLDDDIQVIHALEDRLEPDAAATAIIDAAIRLLKEEGIERCHGRTLLGSLPQAVEAVSPRLVVMGKRGVESAPEPGALGSHVVPVLGATSAPVCLASKIFLPIRRALVLLDADMDHRSAVEFVQSNAALQGIDTDLIVTSSDGQDAAPKIAWARDALKTRDGDIFGVEAQNLRSAILTYTQSRRCDLIIVSRAVLSSGVSAEIAGIKARGIWSWRTPILVC